MCAPTVSKASEKNTNANSKQFLRRLRTPSPTSSVVESYTTRITPENITINTALSYSLDERASSNDDKRRERRRRARRVGNARPDSSGRIGNKECHCFAFAEQLEEKVAMAA